MAPPVGVLLTLPGGGEAMVGTRRTLQRKASGGDLFLGSRRGAPRRISGTISSAMTSPDLFMRANSVSVTSGQEQVSSKEQIVEEAARILEHHQEECQNYFSDWQNDLVRLQREHMVLCSSLAQQLRTAGPSPEPGRPTSRQGTPMSRQETIRPISSNGFHPDSYDNPNKDTNKVSVNTNKSGNLGNEDSGKEPPVEALPSAPPGSPPEFGPRPPTATAVAWADPHVPENSEQNTENRKTSNSEQKTNSGVTSNSTEVVAWNYGNFSPRSSFPIQEGKADRKSTKSTTSRFGDRIALLYGVERQNNNQNAKTRGTVKLQKARTMSSLRLPRPTGDTCLQRFVRSLEVRTVCSIAILANAIYMGVHAQEQLKSLATHRHGLGPEWENVETGFCIFFGLELGLRFIAERKNFLRSEDTPWNLFDTFLVALSTVDILMATFAASSGLNFTFARTMRIFRFARILRIVRVMRFFYSFRLMVYSVIYSSVSLLWVFVMLLFVLYFFAIFFLHGVAEFFEGKNWQATDILVKNLLRDWGDVPAALQSLFQAISGGKDWGDLQGPLNDVGDAYGWVFIFYVFFMVFGVLNVVMASFVDSASQISRKDRELVTQNEMERQRQYAANIRRFFHEADVDKTGSLSWEEFEKYLQNEKVQAYFQSFELDVSQARTLFKLLDLDESNDVGIDEFVEGCMRMKGPARSIDVNIMLYEHEKMMDRQVDFMAYVEEQFQALESVGVTPTQQSMESRKRMTRIHNWAKERETDKLLTGRASRRTVNNLDIFARISAKDTGIQSTVRTSRGSSGRRGSLDSDMTDTESLPNQPLQQQPQQQQQHQLLHPHRWPVLQVQPDPTTTTVPSNLLQPQRTPYNLGNLGSFMEIDV